MVRIDTEMVSEHKYRHKEKTEYKQAGKNMALKLFWAYKLFFPNEALMKKEIMLTEGLVTRWSSSAQWCRTLGGPSPSSPIWLQQMCTGPTLSDFVHGICKGINCHSHPGLGYLLALVIFIFQQSFSDWNSGIFRWETTDLDIYISFPFRIKNIGKKNPPGLWQILFPLSYCLITK